MKIFENKLFLLGFLCFGLILLTWSIFRLLFIPYKDFQDKHEGRRRNTPLSHFISEEDLYALQIRLSVCIAVLGLVAILPLGLYALFLPLGLLVVFSYLIPAMYFQFLIKKRNKEFDAEMLDFIILVTNALRAGQSCSSAIDIASMHSETCVREEFQRALEEYRSGWTFKEAIKRINGRISSENLKLFTTICVANEASGGSLIPILENIITMIRKQIAFQGKLPILVAAQKHESYLLTAMPFIIVLLAGLVDIGNVLPLFTETAGQVFIAIVIVMISLAYVWMKKITDIKL